MSWQVILPAAAVCAVLLVFLKKKTASSEAVRIRIDLRSEGDMEQITSLLKRMGVELTGVEQGEQIFLTVRPDSRETLYKVLEELAELPFVAAARELRAD